MSTTIQSVIEKAQSDTSSIASLLRTALDLGYLLDNAPLIEWCKAELNGYFEQDEVPSYRQTIAINKGVFFGLGLQATRDIPTGILSPEQRRLYEKMVFRQSMGSLQKLLIGDSRVVSAPWNPNDVAIASQTIYERMTMTQAWQEASTMVIENIVETVQNNIYFLALDLRRKYPKVKESDESLKSVSSQAATSLVIQHIYGSHPIVTTGTGNQLNVSQIAQPFDVAALIEYLRSIEVSQVDIEDLENAIRADEENGKPTRGQRVNAWLGNFMANAGSGAASGLVVEAIKAFFSGGA